MIQDSQLSLGTKIGWGFADAGINIFVFFKATVVMVFMTQYLGISAFMAGFVAGLVVLTDMVTDPLVGGWSDRTNTPFGRRRPFMVVGALFMFILTYLMFNPPGLTGSLAAIWVFVFYALASVGFTMVVVPLGAMATEMTKSPNERTFMMGFRMAFASIGLLLAGVLAAPDRIGEGGLTLWITIAILMLVPIFVCVLATRLAPRQESLQVLKPREQISILRKHPGFLRHVVAYAVMTLGVAILSAGITYITTNVMVQKAANGIFDTYLSQETWYLDKSGAEKTDLLERLGLKRPEEGWQTLSGQAVNEGEVQLIDPRQEGWFDALDIKALNDSAYGRRQVGALKQVLNGAIRSEVSGLPHILMGVAGSLFSTVFAMFLLGSILSQLVWVPLAGRIGRDRALVLGLSIYGAFALAYYFILSAGHFDWIIYGAFLLGFCNGAYQNLPWSILPTMIDKANAQDDVQVEGVFNGFWLSGQKIANTLGPWLLGSLLAFAGWASSLVDFQLQSKASSHALTLMMTVVPGIFFLLAIPLFLSVPKALRS